MEKYPFRTPKLGDIYYYLNFKSFFAETLQIQQKNIPRSEQYPDQLREEDEQNDGF